MAQQQAGSVIFAHMQFPEYQFREFPKWVTASNGERVLVQNAEEEESVCEVAGPSSEQEDEEGTNRGRRGTGRKQQGRRQQRPLETEEE
ncbi:hypothetical protein UFOVP1414_69 [uncultured Caudovirales phage]|uniref:Uncharacterized protein n=1 Tax=uncultured Caudovirales phage TaxID=2100421 RepID=A0A6J5MF15_9CAUD|nr:hypothetical protein UFOVP442_8 [uncultured Caudovirales phage]CAB4211973.1 hypothetical protein UFOVP1414_69 [uncultured Caudovirales phage]